jgi:SAM-dependent methyltransferase
MIFFEHGKCFICGNNVDFQAEEGFSLREAGCPICQGSKRNRDLAKTIIRTYLKDDTLSLAEGLEYLQELAVFEVEASGPIHNYLGKLPKYICSEYFDNVPPGSVSGSGIRHEDLERLTFPNNSFDLVITQDVFEHVSNPERGFLEIRRVLKSGGYHIFTVPFHEGRKTVRRVTIKDGRKVFLLPPVHHGDPLRESGSLVYTDFGDDIIENLKSLGLPTEIALHEKFYQLDAIPCITDYSSY